MSARESVHDHDVLDFLAEWALDRECGSVLPLGHYLARYPGREEAIAREFLQLHDSGTPAAPSDDRSVGPFDLVRELGRGAQGAVWLARDRRFGREVALKVLHGGQAALASGSRFRREATVAARLDHPNLATVFDAGEEVGCAWLAMRYVPGESLATALARARAVAPAGEGRCLRLPHVPVTASEREALSAVVAFVARAARAVAVAHAAGVVHRDVKPGNLMVTPQGEPVLVDFGLARDPESSAVCLTQTGEQLGTPAYMAPEQLEPGRVPITAAVDLWALAVVLFECATLAHPFQEATRQAMQRAIVEREAPAARALHPAIPKGLANVLVVALQKDPRRRYASAAAFAADLELVAAGEPPTCRPPGVWSHCLRLARRHPRTSASLACVVAFVVVALAWLDHAYVREAELRAKATARAADLRQLARGLLFDLHAVVRSLPGATEVTRELGTRALDYLRLLRQEAVDDRQLRADVVRALLQVGDVMGNPRHSNLGQHTAAVAHYREALDLLGEGTASDDDRLRAECRLRLGEMAERDGDLDAALVHWREALARLPATPDDVDANRLAVTLHLRIGECAAWSTTNAERATAARVALERAAALVGDPGSDATARMLAATVQIERARSELTRGDLAVVQVAGQAARTWLDGLPAEHTLHLPVRCLRGSLEGVLGACEWKQGRAVDARARLERAAASFAELAALDPRNEQVARLRLQTLGTLSFVLLDQELHGDCKSVLVAIDALVRDAAERFGTDWFQQQQAECQSRLAQLAYQRRDFAEAQALFESAAATHRRRAQAYPDNLQIAGHAALAQLRLGWAFVRASRAAEAEPVLAVAIAELRRLSALDPSVLPWRNGLVAAAQQLAELAFQRGDHAAARTHYGDAIAAEQDLPASPEHERSLAILRQGLAEACTQDGDAGAALAPVRAAVAALRALVVAAPQDRYVARLLATALANQARHELAAGHAAVVEATVQEALRVLAPLSGVVDAEAAAVFATEAMAHIVLGRCLFDAGARDRARNEVAAAREALARSPAASAKMPAQFGRMLDRLARDLD